MMMMMIIMIICTKTVVIIQEHGCLANFLCGLYSNVLIIGNEMLGGSSFPTYGTFTLQVKILLNAGNGATLTKYVQE
jgi:hypothetical protein